MTVPDVAQLVETDTGLASHLRYSVMRLRRRLVHERHPDNELSIGAMSVLGCLVRNGEQTPADLARFERVQPPTMTRTLKCLLESGHVTRRRDENDGRQVLIGLTDKGRALVLEDRERRTAWLARRLEELSPEERDVLRAAAPILERLAQGD